MTTPLPPISSGIGCLYSPPPPSAQEQLASLRASPIAHFTSAPNDGYGIDNGGQSSKSHPIPTSGRLLAVNSRYVAYAVRKGLVRVIDRQSAAKALLRGHDGGSRLVDASFFPGGRGGGGGGGRGDDNNDDRHDVGGVSGLWLDLVEARDRQRGRGTIGGTTMTTTTTAAAVRGCANSPPAVPCPGGADVLATIGGIRDRASVLIWRLRSSGKDDSNLGADKLTEIRVGGVGVNLISWHPSDPCSFLLLHRNLVSECEGGKTIGILVDTKGLRTRRDDVEGHAVCDLADDVEGAGARMIVSDTGANDVAWSSVGNESHALTGHDDGVVNLWDLSSSSSSPLLLASSMWVGKNYDEVDGGMRRVTRVLFLPRYADPASCAGDRGRGKDRGEAVTPPFVVGTDMNHTVALYSSFRRVPSGDIAFPTLLRVFGLRRVGVDLSSASDMMSLEICPAPYRPKSSRVANGVVSGIGGGKGGEEEEDVAPPSSFVLMAERNVGLLHALHLDTVWSDYGDNASASSTTEVAVVGFDYVTTLNVVHPVYSLSVAPPPPSIPPHVCVRSLTEEIDVTLCCLQSKVVQMLTLTGGMCAPPESRKGMDTGNLAPGVTLLGRGDDVHDKDDNYEDYGDDGDEEGDDDAKEEEFEEDYDVEEDDGLADVEYSTNDSVNEDDRGESAPTTAATTEPDSFSNWLCSIAVPSPPPTSAAAVTTVSPPPTEMLPRTDSAPPGLGFPSVMPPTHFLLPDQVLSFSGSESDVPFPKSIAPLAPVTSGSVASSAMASSLAGKPPKKSNKKNGLDGAKKAQAPQSNRPHAPVKILLRQEPNLEPAIDTPPRALPKTAAADTSCAPVVSAGVSNADLQREVATQIRSHEAQLLSLLRETIASEVTSAVLSSFKDMDKRTGQAVQREISSGLSSGWGTSLDKKLGKMAEKVAKDSATSAAKEAVEAIQPLIMNSLHQTMREVMIPAYEAATRQMFEQTSMSLDQGLTQMTMNQTNASVPVLQAMITQMTQMSEAIQLLTAEVAQLRGVVDASGSNQTHSNIREIQEGTALPLGIRDEIAALCQAQKYEDAFTKAVSASDGDLVLYACKKADAETLFNGDELSISQPIMICLLQQLGAMLVPATDAGDIKTILKWLQEIAVTIDPSNVNIQRHVGSVVQQLLVNINGKMSTCDPVFRRPMQTLVQVIRGLVM